MLTPEFLIDLAIILLSTKVLGLLTRKFHLPQVVGAILAGLILGPSVLGVLRETELIKNLAQLGVLIILFSAGLQVDVSEIKKAGKASVLVALFGVLLPLVGGFLVSSLFELSFLPLLQHIFIGVILTATSVSITVETLQELGKIKTRTSTVIMSAAIIDDVIAIILLSVVTGLSATGGSVADVGSVIFRVLLFFLIAFIVGIPFKKMFNSYSRMHHRKRRFPIFAFAFALFLAYIGDQYFGVADIAGAFIAGMIVSHTVHSGYIQRRFEILSYMLLTPLFFASIGISIELTQLSLDLLWFTLALTAIAIATKIFGGFIGARLAGLENRLSFQVGIGMVARSEVALIITSKGFLLGALPAMFFAPVAMMVILTSILTPIMLKFAFSEKSSAKTIQIEKK